MAIPLKNQSATERRLTHVEILNLFVITLEDVYTSKTSLLAQLPYLAAVKINRPSTESNFGRGYTKIRSG